MRLYIIIMLQLASVILPFTGQSAEPNPLSRFSPRWDEPQFKKAEPMLMYFLNSEEKELLHIINLARLSPALFSETVLIPYALKHGIAANEIPFIGRSGYTDALNEIDMTLFHKVKAKKEIDSLRIHGKIQDSGGFIIEPHRAEKNLFAWKRSMAKTPLDILLGMLTDSGSCGKMTTKILLGPVNAGGLIIRKNNDGMRETVLLTDSLPLRELSGLKTGFICDYEKLEEIPLIDMNLTPNDALMQYIFKQDPPFPKNEIRIVSNGTFDRIMDSIEKEKLWYEKYECEYLMNPQETERLRRSGVIGKEKYSIHKFVQTTTTQPDDNAEKELFIANITRTAKVCNGNITAYLRTVYVAGPMVPFSADSIGKFDPATYLGHVDAYVRHLVIRDSGRIAQQLIEPWTTELEKVRAIFMWLVLNFEYAHDDIMTGDHDTHMAELLRTRKAKCQGYSDAFEFLCRQAGIKSLALHGYASKGLPSNHAWNVVRINGKWYLLDVTWGENYFLTTPEKFIRHHLPLNRAFSLLPHHIRYKDWSNWNTIDDIPYEIQTPKK